MWGQGYGAIPLLLPPHICNPTSARRSFAHAHSNAHTRVAASACTASYRRITSRARFTPAIDLTRVFIFSSRAECSRSARYASLCSHTPCAHPILPAASSQRCRPSPPTLPCLPSHVSGVCTPHRAAPLAEQAVSSFPLGFLYFAILSFALRSGPTPTPQLPLPATPRTHFTLEVVQRKF